MILSMERMYNVHIILVCECSWFIPPLWSSDDRALSLFLFCQGMAWVLISYSPLSRIVFNSTTAGFTSIYLTILLYHLQNIIYKLLIYVTQILLITINSLVLYSTVPQPTPLYIDPHRSALACFASGVSEGRFSKWWVDVDIAQHIHFIIRLENERTLDLYNYSFILLPNINCFVMLNIHTISSMTIESGGYIIMLYITSNSKKDEWDN